MSNGDQEESGNIPNAINAVANLAKAVPVYDDALKPLMQETGKALSVVGRTVNVALAPVRGFVWGAEQIETWLSQQVSRKLKDVPPEAIVTPDLAVAGPTIEALKFNGHKSELSEMFAGLLAGSMNSSTKDKAHPSYVEVIKSMSSLDARLFAVVAGRQSVPTIDIRRKTEGMAGDAPVAAFYSPEFVRTASELKISPNRHLQAIQGAIENLARLGVVGAINTGHLTSDENLARYEKMEQGSIAAEFRKMAEGRNFEFVFKRSYVTLTQFGKDMSEIVFIS